MKKYADIMEDVCPNVLFLNYTNPMAILSGYMQRYTGIKTVGLCHSVQSCVPTLAKNLDMPELNDAKWKIAGINHMAWLLELTDKEGNDLYPALKKKFNEVRPKGDLVRLDMMNHFGYYNTESSEHTARIPSLLHQGQISRIHRKIQHSSRRISAPLRQPDRGLGKGTRPDP